MYIHSASRHHPPLERDERNFMTLATWNKNHWPTESINPGLHHLEGNYKTFFETIKTKQLRSRVSLVAAQIPPGPTRQRDLFREPSMRQKYLRPNIGLEDGGRTWTDPHWEGEIELNMHKWSQRCRYWELSHKFVPDIHTVSVPYFQRSKELYWATHSLIASVNAQPVVNHTKPTGQT